MRLKRLLLQRNEVGYASRERPPAVVLRGRAVRSRSPPPRHTRHHRATPPQLVEQQQRPQRISLLDRPFVLNPAVPPYPKVRFDRQGAWTQAAPARRTARTNPPLTAFSVPPDLFDYAWDPHEREEAVWRDPSSRHQVLVSNNADVIPLDEQHIATDNEEDTADPNYFPGRRRSDELDPDQSDIEDQFLARVRPPSSHRSVYLDKGGAAPSAPAEESTATSSKGAAAPSAPAKSSHSKIPKGYRSSDTPSPPTSVGRRPNSAGARAWFREEPTRLEAAYPRERSPRQRKPPPAPQGPKVAPVSQAVVRGYKDPPSADKIGCTIIPEKREPKKPVLKDPPKSLAKQPSTPPPDYPPGKAPPKFGEQQLNPPPPRPGPPSRPPPVHTVINSPRPDPPDLPKGAASSAPKAAGTSRGVAKGAPTSHRARQNYQPDEPDLSIFRRHGYNWKCHAVTEIPNAFDDHRITIGIDWDKTCTPLLLDGSFWAPTPLFAQQLREISEDYPVQFVIVSFSGWTGLDRTQWPLSVCRVKQLQYPPSTVVSLSTTETTSATKLGEQVAELFSQQVAILGSSTLARCFGTTQWQLLGRGQHEHSRRSNTAKSRLVGVEQETIPRLVHQQFNNPTSTSSVSFRTIKSTRLWLTRREQKPQLVLCLLRAFIRSSLSFRCCRAFSSSCAWVFELLAPN